MANRNTSDLEPVTPTQLDQTVDDYIAAWNEHDAARRLQILGRVLAPDCIYEDPTVRTATRTALHDHIGRALAAAPGRRIIRTTVIDAHHRTCRFGWLLIKPDGERGLPSIDVVELGDDGRIVRITGFFGPLAEL